MRRRSLVGIIGMLCITIFAGCSSNTESGSAQGGTAAVASQGSAVPADDAITIDQIDWTVQEEVIDGDRCVGFSYVNNSDSNSLELR